MAWLLIWFPLMMMNRMISGCHPAGGGGRRKPRARIEEPHFHWSHYLPLDNSRGRAPNIHSSLPFDSKSLDNQGTYFTHTEKREGRPSTRLIGAIIPKPQKRILFLHTHHTDLSIGGNYRLLLEYKNLYYIIIHMFVTGTFQLLHQRAASSSYTPFLPQILLIPLAKPLP